MTEEHRETASVGYVFVDDTGQEHGPFEAEVLQAMAQCGEFHANNYVRHSHEQEWHLASDLAWLGFASSAEASTETVVNQSPSNGRLSPAAIVGIVIGVVILIIIIATSGGKNGDGAKPSNVSQLQLVNHYEDMRKASERLNQGIYNGDHLVVIASWTNFADAWEAIANDAVSLHQLDDDQMLEKREELSDYVGKTRGLNLQNIKRKNPALARRLSSAEFFAKCERQEDRISKSHMQCLEIIKKLVTKRERAFGQLGEFCKSLCWYNQEWGGTFPIKDGLIDWDLLVDYFDEEMSRDEMFVDPWDQEIGFTWLDYKRDVTQLPEERKKGDYFEIQFTSYGADGTPGGQGDAADVIVGCGCAFTAH